MIYPGHSGDAKSYPEGTKASSRGEWYAMQVETTNDYEVPWLVSVFCGGLNRQIEHHLFPGIAPPRLRAIAPEVRRICEEHGVEYRTGTWGQMLGRSLRRIAELQDAKAGSVRERLNATLEAMT
jgi:linoleoyl-CoA desaturase